MKHWLLLLLLTATGLGIGCATSSTDEKISTIPWNRPQPWEGTGALGGMRPPGAP
ncbi:MAG: hypothetical protein WCH84_00205 [Verrucomicrobiota bacterium]